MAGAEPRSLGVQFRNMDNNKHDREPLACRANHRSRHALGFFYVVPWESECGVSLRPQGDMEQAFEDGTAPFVPGVSAQGRGGSSLAEASYHL